MIDVIKYKHGLGAPASQLPMFLNVMGMACVSLLVRRPANVAWASLPTWERHRIVLLALIDAASGVCVMHGEGLRARKPATPERPILSPY